MSYRSFRIDDILREDWNNGASHASSGANNLRNTDTNETSGEFAHDTVYNLLEDDIEIEKQPHTRAGNHTHEVQHLQCGKKRESRKARTAFTDDQLRSLEQTFQKHKYLDSQHRVELSEEIGLTDLQVKTWYQNRRTKWKRQTLIEIQNCVRSYAMIKQVSPSFVKYDPIKAMVELNVDIIRANATMHSV